MAISNPNGSISFATSSRLWSVTMAMEGPTELMPHEFQAALPQKAHVPAISKRGCSTSALFEPQNSISDLFQVASLRGRDEIHGLKWSWKQPNNLPIHIKGDMKLKAKITGPKVHDVGYRIFLMEAALDCGVMRISAYWRKEDSPQTLTCLVEADEARITAFRKFIESHKPVKAEVSAITWEDYDGEVMHISEFAQICTCMVLQKLFV